MSAESVPRVPPAVPEIIITSLPNIFNDYHKKKQGYVLGLFLPAKPK
jgi:hypothetical protein